MERPAEQFNYKHKTTKKCMVAHECHSKNFNKLKLKSVFMIKLDFFFVIKLKLIFFIIKLKLKFEIEFVFRIKLKLKFEIEFIFI